MPFCGYGFLIGFAIACIFSYYGHAGTGVTALLICFFIGVIGDIAQIIWRFFWKWTQECGWCGKRVSPLTRNRVISRELQDGKFWFCSPKCLTEWHRRHFSERKQINILSEGEPFIKFPKE